MYIEPYCEFRDLFSTPSDLVKNFHHLSRTSVALHAREPNDSWTSSFTSHPYLSHTHITKVGREPLT